MFWQKGSSKERNHFRWVIERLPQALSSVDTKLTDLELLPRSPAKAAVTGEPIRTEQDADDEHQRYIWRIWFIVTIFIILTLFIFLRLLSYQIFGDIAPSPQLPSRNPEARGVIVDKNGNLFAADRFVYELRIAPDQMKSDDERILLANALEAFLGISAAETAMQLRLSADQKYLLLAKEVPFEQGQMVLQWVRDTIDEVPSLKVLEIAPIPKRYYPQDSLAAQTIGFVGLSDDRNAHYGLEEYYNTFLKDDGVSLTEPNSSLSIEDLPLNVRQFIPSASENDIVLTLDRGIQWIIEDELALAIQLYEAQSGTIIVMDPQTGAIRGLANLPSYNPNRYPETTDLSLFTNPALSAQYEPGSIFKVITMAAALDSETISPYTPFVDSGSITIGERIIFNSSRSAYGEVTASEALALSINVVTAEIAQMLGPDQLYDYIRRFGFGRATKVDLAGEIPGLLKTPSSPDWSISDLGTNSFGQGIAVTPLQMVSAVAAIANDGMLLRPYCVQSRIQNGKVQETMPTVVQQVISPESAALLTDMMVGVIENSVKSALVQGYRVAGKTGTAQIPGEGGYLEDQVIVSFVGFGPVEDPEFVILIKLDRPNMQISQWATTSAAPIFSRVATRLFEYAGLQPQH